MAASANCTGLLGQWLARNSLRSAAVLGGGPGLHAGQAVNSAGKAHQRSAVKDQVDANRQTDEQIQLQDERSGSITNFTNLRTD